MSASWMMQALFDGDVPDPKNPMVTDLSSIGVKTALMTFSSLGILCFLIFCTVRTFFKDIYSPRRSLKIGRPPQLPRGFFAWIGTVWSATEPFILSTVGLDGVMLLRFLKMSCLLFTVLSILGLSVLVPINFHAYRPVYTPEHPYDEIAALRELTVENVPPNSPWLRVHLAFTWIFSFIAYFFLIVYYRGHVHLRQHYIMHVLRRSQLTKIEHRSLIVFGVPNELRHEVDLAAFFEGLGVGRVENAVICRKWSKLREAVHKRFLALQNLEQIYNDVKRGKGATWMLLSRSGSTPAQRAPPAPRPQPRRFSASEASDDASLSAIMSYLQAVDPRMRPTIRVRASQARAHEGEDESSGIFSPVSAQGHTDHTVAGKPWWRKAWRTVEDWFEPRVTVDAANHWASEYRMWDARVTALRRVPEKSPATAVGFVTFESPQSAAIAAQIILHRRPFTCMAKPAPEPRDIFWPNLSSRAADSAIKFVRSAVVHTVSLLIILFSTFFSVFIVTPLLTLKQLTSLPVLGGLFEQLGDPAKKFVEQVVPITLFATWTSSLPSILILLSQFQGLEAESWIDMAMFSKYFFFLTFNVLLFVVGQTIWFSMNTEVISTASILDILGSSMPKSSPFMIGYVMLQSLAVLPAQLLLVAPLILTWVYRHLPWSQSWTPRTVSSAYHPTQLTSLSYGMIYAMALLVFVIGVTYAAIAPLVLPFCAVYFAVAHFIYKYILLYVHTPRFETGGMHTPMVTRRGLSGIALMQITMMAVLAIKFGGSGNSSDPIPPGDGGGNQTIYNTTPEPLGGDKNSAGWSGYAQMIIGILPLVIFTLFLQWWMSQGYDKLVEHPPMEEMGEVLREVNELRGKVKAGETKPSTATVQSSRGVPGVSPRGSDHGESLRSKLMTGLGRFGSTIGTELRSAHHPVSPSATSRSVTTTTTTVKILGSGGEQLYHAEQQEVHHHGVASASLTGSTDKRLLRHRDSYILRDDVESLFEETVGLVQEPPSDDEVSPLPTGSREASSPNAGLPIVAAGEDDADVERQEAPSRGPRKRKGLVLANFLPSVGSSSSHANQWLEETPETDDVNAPLLNKTYNPLGPQRQSSTPGVVVLTAYEPPSTRVPGILDAPVDPSPLLAGMIAAVEEDEASDAAEEGVSNGTTSRGWGSGSSSSAPHSTQTTTIVSWDAGVHDLQSETYLHPALIGRLPVAWLPGPTQPDRLVEAREEQVRAQRALVRRIIGLQRAGVAAVEGRRAEEAAAAAAAAAASDVNGAWAVDEVGETEGEEIRRFGVTRWVASFFEGITSWAHLETSFL